MIWNLDVVLLKTSDSAWAIKRRRSPVKKKGKKYMGD